MDTIEKNKDWADQITTRNVQLQLKNEKFDAMRERVSHCHILIFCQEEEEERTSSSNIRAWSLALDLEEPEVVYTRSE